MSNLNNPKNAVGMGNLLMDDQEDLDIDELEKSIINGSSIVKKTPPVDLAKEYSKEIDDLGKKFGVTNAKFNDMHSSTNSDDLDDILNWTPKPTKQSFSSSEQIKSPYNLLDSDKEDEPAIESSNSFMHDNSKFYYSPKDDQLIRMTNEERKQNHVNQVLSNMDRIDDEEYFIQQEDDEDEMAKIMEQIDLLHNHLESVGVDLSKIPEVNSGTSKKEAKSILRILQLKNDRSRYSDFFDESILALAYGLEGIFNGQREIFGSKIDLTGYSDTVKVKLHKMKYDTSNFVSTVMQGYNISSGWRIALELIPSLFFYSRDRKISVTSGDNLISDENYKRAIQDIQH